MDGIFYAKAAAFIGAAVAMGLGSLGPALGQGMIAMTSKATVIKSIVNSGHAM